MDKEAAVVEAERRAGVRWKRATVPREVPATMIQWGAVPEAEEHRHNESVHLAAARQVSAEKTGLTLPRLFLDVGTVTGNAARAATCACLIGS